jgi:hypothetical protein
MLQHANIDTFVRHYSVGVHVDAQAIVRGLPPQKRLMRFACSMSRSIDPRRPYKLSPEDSSSINELPRVRGLQELFQKHKQTRDLRSDRYKYMEGEYEQALCEQRNERQRQLLQKNLKRYQEKYNRAHQKYQRALRGLRNEKQWQRNRLIRGNLERYKNEQPVIDSERQLAGKMVDEEVIGALQRTGYMISQHMILIDTVLTMPSATIEAEYRRRIAAINAVIAFCDVEEGSPSQRLCLFRKRPATDAVLSAPAKRQECSAEDKDAITLRLAITSVRIDTRDQRPQICFLCVGNLSLPIEKRTMVYSTPGSLSRHVQRLHIKPPWPEDGTVRCNICNVDLEHKMHLMNHAESKHGIVSRVPLSL